MQLVVRLQCAILSWMYFIVLRMWSEDVVFVQLKFKCNAMLKSLRFTFPTKVPSIDKM